MSGHGHVIPNSDGTLAKCGGPGICAECSVEYARVTSQTRRGARTKLPALTGAITVRGLTYGQVPGMEDYFFKCTLEGLGYTVTTQSRHEYLAVVHALRELAAKLEQEDWQRG